MTAAALYCVADSRYFLGAVAMINSLRLHGHAEPIYLLDAGLEPEQRALLEPEVAVVAAPSETAPHLLKTVAPLAYPADVMVLIDADMIVTRNLGELIERAGEGGVVAFRDRQQRFFSEWGELDGLGGVERGPYVSSGLVAAGGFPGRRVIELMHELRERVDFERTFWRANDRDYPYLYADQDLLNAILAAGQGGRLVALEERLAATPPFRTLRTVDRATLRCEFPDGAEPYVLHQFVRKPWLEPMYHGAYSQLFARLLVESDVPIQVPEAWVPSRLRPGARARVERTIVNAADLGRWYLGDRLPAWLGTRVEAARRARSAR